MRSTMSVNEMGELFVSYEEDEDGGRWCGRKEEEQTIYFLTWLGRPLCVLALPDFQPEAFPLNRFMRETKSKAVS